MVRPPTASKWRVSGVALCLAACSSEPGLGPLGESQLREHRAPRSGECPSGAVEAGAEWLTEMEGDGLRAAKVAVDECGSVTVAYSAGSGAARRVETARLFGDSGTIDWRLSGDDAFDPERWDQWPIRDLAVDEHGNAIVLGDQWLRVVNAAGEVYPGTPVRGYPGGRKRIYEDDEFWVVAGQPRFRAIPLPETWSDGQDVVSDADQGTWGLAQDSTGRRWVAFPESGGIYVQSWDGYDESQDGPLDMHGELEPDWDSEIHNVPTEGGFPNPTLLAAAHDRLLLGWSLLDEWACIESHVVDVKDPTWSMTLEPCGTLNALHAGSDGSVLSLWMVHDAELPLLRPILTHTASDASPIAEWDLGETLGLVEEHLYEPGMADFAVVDGGRSVVVVLASDMNAALELQDRVTVVRFALD